MDRIEHAEQLFGQILELPREQWPAFLDRECAGNPALRRRLQDLLDAFLEAVKYFSEEQVCIDAVAEMRWPNGVACPHCEAEQPYYLKTQKRWKCRKCRNQFSVKVGSIFEDSPILLQKWLPALWLLVNCKNGISSYEIARDLASPKRQRGSCCNGSAWSSAIRLSRRWAAMALSKWTRRSSVAIRNGCTRPVA
jgi:transposase-like protein